MQGIAALIWLLTLASRVTHQGQGLWFSPGHLPGVE